MLWDAESGSQVALLEGHTEAVAEIAWSQSGERLASASYDKTVMVWDAEGGSKVGQLDGHADWLTGMA